MYSSCLRTPGMSSFMANKVNNYARMSKFSITFFGRSFVLDQLGSIWLSQTMLSNPLENTFLFPILPTSSAFQISATESRKFWTVIVKTLIAFFRSCSRLGEGHQNSRPTFGNSCALTLLVWHQEENPACKNWVMGCWCRYLSGAGCRLFAYGPADATTSQNPIISCRF